MKAFRSRTRKPKMTKLGSFVAEFAKPIRDTFGEYDPKMVCVYILSASNLSKASLDIAYFDEWMQKKFKYDIDKDGSLKDFIDKKFGSDAVELVEKLIDGVNVRVKEDTIYTTYKTKP